MLVVESWEMARVSVERAGWEPVLDSRGLGGTGGGTGGEVVVS